MATKLQRLRDNIAAIECALKGENNKEALRKYSGFGGMNFILNPVLDKSRWSKGDMAYYEDTARLVHLLAEHSRTMEEASRWMTSLKQSVLTAFYTPREIPGAIFKSIFGNRKEYHAKGFLPGTMLDPAAGMGVFGTMCKYVDTAYTGSISVTYFEKDILTATMLKALRGDGGSFVYCDGFENFPGDELGTYDLVSTNVPFGDIAVFDPAYTNGDSQVRRDAAKMIHRYFVLKGLDALRDGGLLAYIITSNYINNDQEQLQEALKQSRLIGAYRLPNNLFKENGTEVGTDLLVLQKDVNKKDLSDEECMLLTPMEVEGCPSSLYFQVYPLHEIATSRTAGTDAYGKPGLVYYHEDGVKGVADSLETMLRIGMEKFDVAIWEKGRTKDERPAAKAKSGKKPTKQEADLQVLHGCYLMLYENEMKSHTVDEENRRNLNELYHEYIGIYGHLNDKKTRDIAKRLNMVDVLALEVKGDDGKWQKADIFYKPVAFSTEERTGPMTAQEALATSLNDTGIVNIGPMIQMTGLDESELVEQLRGEIFYNPLVKEESTGIAHRWEIKAKFVCGNVIEKLAQIEPIYEKEKEKGENPCLVADLHTSVEALRAAIPTPIPFEDLDFNLGERWVDPQVYADFASEFFSMPEDPECSWRGGAAKVTVKLAVDQYVAAVSGPSNERIRTQYSVTSETGNRLDGIDLLQHALNDTTPKLMRYKRNERGAYVMTSSDELAKEEDPEAVQAAKTKIDEIRQGYADWLQRRPKEFRDKLAAKYNRLFNCTVKPVYDGSHLRLDDVDWKGVKEKFGFDRPYKSQLDAIWMIICLGGGVCDHEVGSGKTLIMCAAAHIMKRLGMVHKPMIIGMKANVSAIADLYRTMYPQDKVLFATESDYSASNRVDFFNRMKTGDWNAIIMSHDQFGKIPQSDAIQQEQLYDALRQCDDALEAVSAADGYEISSKMRRGVEKRKANLNAKLLNLQNTIRNRKDRVTDFEQMGIDFLLCDEYQVFKNDAIVTRHDRVAGLGCTEGSQRAFNFRMAVYTIQKRRDRDLGAVFFSGTVVTNSLTELYVLFRYLRPRALKRLGITCFDAWAAIFTKKSAEYEFSVTNTIVLKERFRYFIKVPELAMFYNEVTDFKTAEDVGIDRPRKHPMLLNIKPTPDQEVYIKTLMKFAQTGDFSLIGIDNPTDAQQKAKMLYATDLARKMSLDMRLIDPQYGDHPNSKASRCAEIVKRYYDAYDEMKGTQLIFSDLSTWQGKSVWSVYGAIRDKLVDDYGIPASEIRFIQEAKSDRAKQEIIRLTNDGKVRVLFGSTTMLGTGVNAQKRVVAVHHLDTPWRPADLEQRDGRAVRKGNEVASEYAGNQVDVIIYAVERSLDSYKFNLLHLKQVFINQLKRGQLNVRTLDEGAMDEKTGTSFADYVSILSGNTDIKDRFVLQKRIAALEGERKNFYRDRHAQEAKRDGLLHDNVRHGQNIAEAGKDWQRFTESRRVADGVTVNDLQLDNFATAEPQGSDAWTRDMARELWRIDNDTVLTPGEYRTIGSVCGFPIVMRTETAGYSQAEGVQLYQNRFMVQGSRILHTVNNGKLPHSSFADTVSYFVDCLELIPQRIAAWEEAVKANRSGIRQLEEIMKADWGKDGMLAEMKQQLARLDEKIARTAGKTEDEVKAQAGQEKPAELPYKFERDRGDYSVSFKRSLLSLVSIGEMRTMADDISYQSRVRDWSGCYGRQDVKPDREIEVVFHNANYPDAWILKAMELQRHREKDASWLAAKASEDTRGGTVTQENETVFAARLYLSEIRKAA